MKLTEENIKYIAKNLSNFTYANNLQTTRELIELFDKIVVRHKLNTPDDYVNIYDDCFYTYQTWEELVESEKDQNDGLTEEELKRELEDDEHGSVWQLPCGWYVQYV